MSKLAPIPEIPSRGRREGQIDPNNMWPLFLSRVGSDKAFWLGVCSTIDKHYR